MRPRHQFRGFQPGFLLLTTCTFALHAAAQDDGTRDPSWLAKARSIVGQMTLEEKVNITSGVTNPANDCVGSTGSVPRLGFLGLCLQDAGNGVRAVDFVNGYPSGIHVGASWDADLAYRRGAAMGNEFRIKGVNVALGPVTGPLGRVVESGRNWEGFSVDPYLAGVLTAQTIQGVQSNGVITSLKHYIGNEQETNRNPIGSQLSVSSNMDATTLRELYLWPFQDGVKAGTGSIMCSYNRFNETYSCENDELLDKILKSDLGFTGFVVSDWGAQHSNVPSANAGLDLTMPSRGFWGSALAAAVANGSVPEDRVTDMATRIMGAYFRFGQDSPAYPAEGVGVQSLTQPHTIVDARVPAAEKVLYDGAVAGHVLVKNNGILPLQKPKMLSIFGYDAPAPPTTAVSSALLQTNAPIAQGGNMWVAGGSGTNNPSFVDAPFNAIQARAIHDDTYLQWDFKSANPSVNPASSACLVFLNAWAQEGVDRPSVRDDFSDGLVKSVAANCANTIVVLHSAGIRLVDQWIEHENVTATIIAHLPGQDTGRALVDILYGIVPPSGKLPYTLARNESDYPVLGPDVPAPGNLSPQSNFTEGLYLDYKHFDRNGIQPRFEFGFGLTYTSFRYSSMVVTKSAASPVNSTASSKMAAEEGGDPALWQTVAHVQATVTNVGKVGAAEVAQLYVGIPGRPVRQLRGFKKAFIQPGAVATVQFDLTRRDLSIWSTRDDSWVLQRGNYTVYVGSSSRILPLAQPLVL